MTSEELADALVLEIETAFDHGWQQACNHVDGDEHEDSSVYGCRMRRTIEALLDRWRALEGRRG